MTMKELNAKIADMICDVLENGEQYEDCEVEYAEDIAYDEGYVNALEWVQTLIEQEV